MKPLATFLIIAISLSACTTFDPYTGEEKTTNTAKGASIGAGVGAVLAYLSNRNEDDARKRNQRILRAAAGGAAIGGGIGFYMDNQEAKLRKQLRDSGVSVVRDGDNINLVMPGNITYDTNSSFIKPSFIPVLNSVAIVLKEYDQTLVVVGGHTDTDGGNSYNQLLSEKRASSVALHLNSKGIVNDRIETVGFGESNPIAENNSPANKEQNRRVEITLIPISQ
ncbi:MAG: outer membrane protein OmpA-like peptidoglycan-associated protein [Oceanicoccus sp.]|jgi:outer membrane protein OmpA-like peptidoglycan-associated protein